jgi:hypothetical protein
MYSMIDNWDDPPEQPEETEYSEGLGTALPSELEAQWEASDQAELLAVWGIPVLHPITRKPVRLTAPEFTREVA